MPRANTGLQELYAAGLVAASLRRGGPCSGTRSCRKDSIGLMEALKDLGAEIRIEGVDVGVTGRGGGSGIPGEASSLATTGRRCGSHLPRFPGGR